MPEDLSVGVPSRIFLGYCSRSHVGDSPQFEHRGRSSRAGQASLIVCAGNSREFDIVVQEELSNRGNVVGPGTQHFPVVVPVHGSRTGVHYSPVGLVAK